MTSAAEMHQDPDDDVAVISPELARVDPELARRLREHEAATVDDETTPPPLLLVAPQELAEEPELPPEVAPAPEPEPEHGLEPEIVRVVVPVRTEAATDELIVPRPADVESPGEPDGTDHPLAAIAARRQTRVTEPPQADHLETDVAAGQANVSFEPFAAAEPAEVGAPVVARAARQPRRWRRRVLSVVLAAVLATGITVGVLAAMGESPVSTADVPGWPTAHESPSGDSTPNQPTAEAP